MAIDFDALDLVRTQNKARLHEKKISDQKKKQIGRASCRERV